MEKRDITLRLCAGRVKRWHSFPHHGEQTVGEHTYGVVQILRYITNDMCSTTTLLAALDHDAAEAMLGDITFHAKKQLGEKVKELEAGIAEMHGLARPLNEEEERVVKLADLLEMGIWACNQIQLGNQAAGLVLSTVIDEIEGMEVLNAYPKAEDIYNEFKEFTPGAGDTDGE